MDGLGGTSEVAERDLERIGRGIAEDDLVGVEVPVLAAKLGISNQSSPAIRSCVRKKGQSSLSITRLSCASAMDMGTGDDLTMEGTTSAMGRAFRFLDLELGVPGTEEAGAVKSIQTLSAIPGSRPKRHRRRVSSRSSFAICSRVITVPSAWTLFFLGDRLRDLSRTRSYRAWRRAVVGVSGRTSPDLREGVKGSCASCLVIEDTGVRGPRGVLEPEEAASLLDGVFGNSMAEFDADLIGELARGVSVGKGIANFSAEGNCRLRGDPATDRDGEEGGTSFVDEDGREFGDAFARAMERVEDWVGRGSAGRSARGIPGIEASSACRVTHEFNLFRKSFRRDSAPAAQRATAAVPPARSRLRSSSTSIPMPYAGSRLPEAFE